MASILITPEIFKATPEQITSFIEEHWPCLFYKGVEFFDTYSSSWDPAITERAKRNGCIAEMQECYLGYNPETDRFAMGFDVWYIDDGLEGFGGELYEFTGELDGTVSDINFLGYNSTGFYSSSGREKTTLCEEAQKAGYVHLRIN